MECNDYSSVQCGIELTRYDQYWRELSAVCVWEVVCKTQTSEHLSISHHVHCPAITNTQFLTLSTAHKNVNKIPNLWLFVGKSVMPDEVPVGEWCVAFR